MPLPIEKSQGSVNNLIKRFQQASDAASRQKERQERTRPPGRSVSGSSSGSGVGSGLPSGSAIFEKSGSGWRRASGVSESGSVGSDFEVRVERGKLREGQTDGKKEAAQEEKEEVLMDEPEEMRQHTPGKLEITEDGKQGATGSAQEKTDVKVEEQLTSAQGMNEPVVQNQAVDVANPDSDDEHASGPTPAPAPASSPVPTSPPAQDSRPEDSTAKTVKTDISATSEQQEDMREKEEAKDEEEQERDGNSDAIPVTPEVETGLAAEPEASIMSGNTSEQAVGEDKDIIGEQGKDVEVGDEKTFDTTAAVNAMAQLEIREQEDVPVTSDIADRSDAPVERRVPHQDAVESQQAEHTGKAPEPVDENKEIQVPLEAVAEPSAQPEIAKQQETKVKSPGPVPAPSTSKSPVPQKPIPAKTTPRQTRAATTPSKTPSTASQTPIKAQKTGGLPAQKSSTPSGRPTKSSAPPTTSTRTSPHAQSKPTTPAAVPRTVRKSLTPSSQGVTPLRPSHTGSTASPSPAHIQSLKPHHTGAITPLRPQPTGTRAIERSPLYAPTASSLAKTKQKVTASPSPVGGKGKAEGSMRKESVGSLSEPGVGSLGSRTRVISSSGSTTSARSRQRTASGDA
ncbi:hypothetical protein HD553DRAFT_311326 [Filobasidium floriforme]|uniref:uncharacterized protein n=1 Tax=Filobasidium floriforme TaxID=5210 RepID=UPI001E8D7177|nr:uncharacterized protein HD553DRAFT_311326 [Filobasidium floriforme]KAH8084631.1 hypothetical protein HD553DRAFT_311326 [Filobasidium floriforme]